MAEYKFLVLTNPQPGQDVKFNDWYDNQHVPDVLRVPEFVSAQRFRCAEAPGKTALAWRYMALYTVRTDDLPGLMTRLSAMVGTEAMRISDAADSDSAYALAYEAI